VPQRKVKTSSLPSRTGRWAPVEESKEGPLRRQPFLLETSCPGVFAAGDVRLGSVKRVASAVGEEGDSTKLGQLGPPINVLL
jgi:thioredoxin reductase